MRVLFVKSSINSNTNAFDIGVGSLATILKQNNYEVRLFLARSWNDLSILNKTISYWNPNVITSSTYASSLPSMRKLVLTIIDSLIATATALITYEYCPESVNFIFAGHKSTKPGHKIALNKPRLSLLIDLKMRIGEGTGAILTIPIIKSAMKIMTEMANGFDTSFVDHSFKKYE